jgi:hypothetical protein
MELSLRELEAAINFWRDRRPSAGCMVPSRNSISAPSRAAAFR